jgi:hypothetical protein
VSNRPSDEMLTPWFVSPQPPVVLVRSA